MPGLRSVLHPLQIGSIDPGPEQRFQYLLLAGFAYLQKEASEVFFSVTKLFQNKDTNLRRMVYLCIKDICPSADEVIIVTSSLMKDMNSKTDLYRSNSVRVLCNIIDSQLLMQVGIAEEGWGVGGGLGRGQ